MHIIIFTGGKLRAGRFTDKALADSDSVIAADSGARAALDFQTLPSVVIGDQDSLDQQTIHQLTEKGCQFIAHSTAKEQTDTELAIDYALRKGATQLTVLGGVEGDRLDHILANILLMAGIKVPIRFTNGLSETWIEYGPTELEVAGQKNDLLSLIPLTQKADKISTTGLKYSLKNEDLYMHKSRGVSNVLTADNAYISFSQGKLLIVHTAVTI